MNGRLFRVWLTGGCDCLIGRVVKHVHKSMLIFVLYWLLGNGIEIIFDYICTI